MCENDWEVGWTKQDFNTLLSRLQDGTIDNISYDYFRIFRVNEYSIIIDNTGAGMTIYYETLVLATICLDGGHVELETDRQAFNLALLTIFVNTIY